MSAHSTTSPGAIAAPEAGGRRHEVLGILAATASVLLGLSLASFDAATGENAVGPAGTLLASLLFGAFGAAAWILPIEAGLASSRLFRGRRALAGPAILASTLVLVMVGCALVHLAAPDTELFGEQGPGGRLGALLGETLASLFGVAGAFVVGIAIFLITVVLRTPLSIVRAMRALAVRAKELAGQLREGWIALVDAWREAKALDEAERTPSVADQPAAGLLHDDESESQEDLDDAPPAVDLTAGVDDDTSMELPPEPEPEPEVEPEPEPPVIVAAPKAKKAAPKIATEVEPEGPVIVAPKRTHVPAKAPAETQRGKYLFPPTDLLQEGDGEDIDVDPATLRAYADKLVDKLASYKVEGRVDAIPPGPVVTMYEFEPAAGTKINKIMGLGDDLAMALAVQKVRVVPLPEKGRIGFELPNRNRKTVYLRTVLEDARWAKQNGALPVALGKDIAGQPVYADLAKMPHLLVAGATGAGKSVGLNVMLASLLYKKTPDEVKMLMIDPKVVELAVFDDIPHMLLPVVTDMSKASLALRWAVDEMERRYQLFADANTRNIGSFNKKVDKVLAGELDPASLAKSRVGKVKAQGPDGEEVLLPPDYGETADALDDVPDKLPHIVVVVDEFADLMMVAAKDVEAAVARLAQKARAAGIHVILATQRPSVDVITGMIKANFPARMSFKVSQREDSKTILGRQGAEHLLGMGDMLMVPPGSSDLRRVHSAFITEDEVKYVCDHLREQGKPIYDQNILKPRDEDDGASGKDDEAASLYDRAVAIVAQDQYCSISKLQRKLKVGYNRAANLVEELEEQGVVGPASGKAGGRREVLIAPI